MPDQLYANSTSAAPDAVARRRRRVQLGVLMAIAAGGVLGSTARYGLAELAPAAAERFPWVTFGINVSGSLALGIVLTLIVERFPPSRYLRPFVATGFLGAYTTYSTFAVETVMLVRDGHPTTAIAYVVASTVVGLAAVLLGIRLGRAIPLPAGRS